ncbi:MAG: hypothetical protein GY747_04045 [Planctomycetes bacterium]|nr:hypothetical protein [Planctomycetota bacterium]MCP4771925.1 hypothetical protein [Planctomycetota bacterium]MCP4859970.1 hypothetical protein [Planctomycetota bacterium]
MSDQSIPILPLWLQRWPAMRTVLLGAFGLIIFLDLTWSLILWLWPGIPRGYQEGGKMVYGFPAFLLFAPALFLLWRWKVRSWCARPLSSRIQILATLGLLLLLAFEVWYFDQVKPRGWLRHKYLAPPFLSAFMIPALCILVLKAETAKPSMTSRLLMRLAALFLAASLSVDLLHHWEDWITEIPVISTTLLSVLLWVYVPCNIFLSDLQIHGHHWPLACVVGFLLACIALWDLKKKRVYWTTAVAMVGTGAALSGFLPNWSYFIWD